MENSTLPENPVAATGNAESEEDGGEDESLLKAEEGDRYSIGNRWPRQETVALLKIRSDMDAAFRDSSPKAPLWEDVSRKLSELGYNRSAKKCKEKFENMHKYHRRTKEGRSGKLQGKTYPFFEQLEALDSNHGLTSSATPGAIAQSAIPTAATPLNVFPNAIPYPVQSTSMNFVDNASTSTASTSSKESERTERKKRKLTEFFGSLMKQVIEKQESLQRRFLEAIERCEQDRMVREEAWKRQELDRIKRERELLAQERSIAAAKDAAVLSFLQNFSEQANTTQLSNNQVKAVPLPENLTVPVEKPMEMQKDNKNDNFVHMSPSRWPKEEIETLIRLRCNLDVQYHDNGLKGPLWEEVSAAMKQHGYDRSAKRCKEKWENMNKYFKRVKDSNKRRPEDAKTCPYFHQLEALYKENTKKFGNSANSSYQFKPEELLMHMMGGQDERERVESAITEDVESENVDQNHKDDA